MNLRNKIANGTTTYQDAEEYERQRTSLLHFLLANGWKWLLGFGVVAFILGALLF